MEAAWVFIRSGAVKLAEIQDSDLPEIHALMSRYGDRPMDFADATLASKAVAGFECCQPHGRHCRLGE